MRSFLLVTVLSALWAQGASAQTGTYRVVTDDEDSWEHNARFFVGLRGGLAVPPGGTGMAPNGGLELGVSAKRGVGFGLHILGMSNPPRVETLDIPKTAWGFGAAADVRFYFQTVEPLTLYPTFSVGFLGGTNEVTGTNVVLPLFNPGFGARVKLDNLYVAFEMGAASFYIPFVTMCIGWEPDRAPKQKQTVALAAPPPREETQAVRPPPRQIEPPAATPAPTPAPAPVPPDAPAPDDEWNK